MCRPAEISTNCTRSQLKGPCAAVRMAGMTKHGCHRTLRTTCLTHSICILAGCEWVGFWWLLIIYVPQSSIRHHCSKVHCSKLAWFAGAQHPISLLGRDARREDASCLFFGGDGWYPAPNQITIDWGWTCPIPINYNHQWSSNHQLINDNSPYTLHKLWLIKWFPRWNGHLRDSFCRSFDSATTIARHELIMVATRSGGPVTGVQTSDALAWRETFSKDWDQHNLGK